MRHNSVQVAQLKYGSWEAEKSHEGDKGGVDRIYFAFDSCDVCLSDFWFEHTPLNILFRN